MTMTKKNYEAIAGAIKARKEMLRPEFCEVYMKDINERGAYNNALNDLAELLCDIFETENERFDDEKFLEACNYGGLPGRNTVKK